jgi:eukaryotic-like serine/threonine-protein kinase
MSEAHKPVGAIFDAAFELPPGQRAAYLLEACAGNEALRERVEALLRAHESAGAFMDSLAVGPREEVVPVKPGERPGMVIGRYKLLQKIGEGGMGVVYMAEQQEPVRRKVALKIIKVGMDTRQVVARFEAERQALALMDHPNIARVLDGGATDSGRPYLVMELVEGVPITDFCDKNRLSVEDRLKLFVAVCQAIQSAHQKGIIHRDLKPTNILVNRNPNGSGFPKVIDFGVAKITGQKLTEKTLFTAYGMIVGTPAYMSPEQAEMSHLDVDTRADIYSLGTLLYELLTGAPPFPEQRLRSAGYNEMQRIILEEQPERPSRRLSTLQGEPRSIIAWNRGASELTLGRTFPDDLDWIVMKCLEKDRARRYETANGLARDIERHLNDEPIIARPPSRLYEFQKTVRRHWVGFAAVGGVLFALGTAAVVSSLELVRARRAEQKAVEAQANQARLRERAQAEELSARTRAYASDMSLAHQALGAGNLGLALDLLNRQRPAAAQKDLRGWEWRYLWQQTRSDALSTLYPETSEINTLAVSPDGNWLAVGPYHQGGLSVWDLRTRQMVVRLPKTEALVRVAFSPADPLLAFAGYAFSSAGVVQNTLRLWNTATRGMVAELSLEGKCAGMAFSKDGRRLITSTSSSPKGQITLWRMPDRTKLASYPSEQADTVGTSFAATPDLSLAAYGLAGGRIRVIDLSSGKDLWTAVGAGYNITALVFSPDGKTLASGGGNLETNLDIRLWNVATGTEIGSLKGHGFWVSSLIFWPDGKKLASSSADQTIRTWDLTSQKCLDVLRGNRQEVWCLALLPDGKTLVSGAKDGAVCSWDTSLKHLQQPYTTIPENPGTWCFTPDSRSVMTVNHQGQVSRWTGLDFQQKEALVEVGTNSFDAYEFSGDGRFLAAGPSNGILQIWDATRRVLCHQWTNAAGDVLPWVFLAGGNKLMFQSVNDSRFHQWDVATGMEIQSWQGRPGSSPQMLAFSPDEQSFVAFNYQGYVVFRKLADMSTNVDLNILECTSGSYSADGNLFVAASALGYARVWDTATWRQKATLGGFFADVSSVCFSPDIKRLAACVGYPSGAMVKLWDVDSWQEVFTLESQFGALINMRFSPDGNIIGTMEYNGRVHRMYLWRAPSWGEIQATETAQALNSATESR